MANRPIDDRVKLTYTDVIKINQKLCAMRSEKATIKEDLMRKFCGRCGKMLQEGEICNCTMLDPVGYADAPSVQSYQQPQPMNQVIFEQNKPTHIQVLSKTNFKASSIIQIVVGGTLCIISFSTMADIGSVSFVSGVGFLCTGILGLVGSRD